MEEIVINRDSLRENIVKLRELHNDILRTRDKPVAVRGSGKVILSVNEADRTYLGVREVFAKLIETSIALFEDIDKKAGETDESIAFALRRE